MASVLNSTATDLSLQLSSLAVDDNIDGSLSTPGDPGPAASTPCRPTTLPCPSSPFAPCTPSYSSQDPSAEEAGSLECSVSSEQLESVPTAPPGGAQSSDTFYCLSCSTKVTFRDRGGQEDPDAETKRSKVTYTMIGGLGSQLDVIRETIELPLKHPELFSNYGTTTAH